jgi:hypothetical protein
MGCAYCGQPCGSREFCDQTCYEEYAEATAYRQPVDDLPGESRYFPEDDGPKEVFPW